MIEIQNLNRNSEVFYDYRNLEILDQNKEIYRSSCDHLVSSEEFITNSYR